MKHRHSGHSIPLILFFAGLLISIAMPLRAGVVARLSSSSTSQEQPFQLTLETQGDASDASPDLSVLAPDFEILGRATQQSVSIINGSFSSKRSLILTLLPKRQGTLTIPPIPFGDQQTEALTLEVTDQPSGDSANAAQYAEVEMSLNKTSAYPEEEVILTVKLFQAAGVRGERLDQPQPSQRDTRLQLLDESNYTVDRNGSTYRVLERNYGLYAYQAGNLEIEPILFQGRRGGNSIFSLLDDPFSTPTQGSRLIRAKSNPVSLQIKPLPSDFSGDHWLPARNIQLLETGIDSSAPIIAGNPLTLRIMLIADGLMSSQLPPITPQVPDDIKPYEEHPQLQDTPRRTGISSSRETVLTLIPTRAGRFTLPAIELPWWNTETGKQEIARLPAKTLDVLPGAASNAPVSGATASQPAVENPPPQQANQQADTPPLPIPAVTQQEGVHWLVWLLAGAWLATLAGWWFTHQRRKPETGRALSEAKTQASVNEQALSAAIDSLTTAYRAGDAEAARDAWLHWGQCRWPQNPPYNLTRLASRCPSDVAKAVISLESALYSPGTAVAWKEAFNPASLQQEAPQQSASRPMDEDLLPLNP
jgi:hypothetical protein